MKNDYCISAHILLFKKQIGQFQKNPNSSGEIWPLCNTHLHTLYHTALHLYAIICALIYIQQAQSQYLLLNQPLPSSMK